MKGILYILGLSGIGVIVFATLKVLFENYFYSWGIFISSMVFVFTLIYWFILVNRNKQQG